MARQRPINNWCADKLTLPGAPFHPVVQMLRSARKAYPERFNNLNRIQNRLSISSAQRSGGRATQTARDSGFYADFFCAAGSLFACIDFTRSAAEAPSTDSP